MGPPAVVAALIFAPLAHVTRPAGSLAATHARASQSVADALAVYTGAMAGPGGAGPASSPLALAARWETVFRAMARELTDSGRWQRQPWVTDAWADVTRGLYTAVDLRRAVDTNFLDAGLGSFKAKGTHGWQMARVGTARGQSFEEAKLIWEEVEEALQRGTVVFNSFGAHDATLAALCLAAVQGWGLPANLNLYMTRPRATLSAPPHTDKQDVVILQTQGTKHWRVYEPPEPSLRPGADPYARGKAEDRLTDTDLGQPLVDCRLETGQVLYVPAGFPHATSTADADSDEPSVHLTVNVDTHIWGINFEYARRAALARAGAGDGLQLTALSADAFLHLNDALPLGALAKGPADADDDTAAVTGLAERICTAQPDRWGPGPDAAAAVSAQLPLAECVDRLRAHHAALLDAQRRLYLDAALELTPAPHGVSVFRVKPYMDELEAVMANLVAWACGVDVIPGTAANTLRSGGGGAAAAGKPEGSAATKAAKRKGGSRGKKSPPARGKGGFG